VTVYLINPSHVSFGIGVITPRWLYVLASATPALYGEPRLIDETPRVGAGGCLVAFIHPSSVNGVLLELVQH